MNLLKLTKMPLYLTSIGPVLLAWFFAKFSNFLIFILLLFFVIFFQMGMNFSMDVRDYKYGRDVKFQDSYFPIGPYSIKVEKISPEKVFLVSMISFLISISLGFIILFLTKKLILLIYGALALFFSYAYLFPPFEFHKRGVGEISTFFNFGPLLFLASLTALGVSININYILISIFFGLSTSAIRFIHHLPEENKNSIRFKKFRIIYSSLVLSSFLILSTVYIIALIFLVLSILHILFLNDVLRKDPEKTGEMVALQFLTVITIIFC